MYKPERHAYPRQHGDMPTRPICQMLTEEQIENEIKKKTCECHYNGGLGI